METIDGDAAALLSELIAIDSSNPDLVPGAAGESAIADLVSAWLARRGFTVHRLESTPGRPSIVAVTTGTGGGRSLMLNGHLDTVTLAGFDGDPLEPAIRDGSMHGRGAFGMKSGLAAMMVAAAEAGIPCLRFGSGWMVVEPTPPPNGSPSSLWRPSPACSTASSSTIAERAL